MGWAPSSHKVSPQRPDKVRRRRMQKTIDVKMAVGRPKYCSYTSVGKITKTPVIDCCRSHKRMNCEILTISGHARSA